MKFVAIAAAALAAVLVSGCASVDDSRSDTVGFPVIERWWK